MITAEEANKASKVSWDNSSNSKDLSALESFVESKIIEATKKGEFEVTIFDREYGTRFMKVMSILLKNMKQNGYRIFNAPGSMTIFWGTD